ncbi:MAG: SURF1 family protein [Actinomycetota bacterium]|nr:SURF1 family protein [Acidimicrobiia bacterium]MDQ3469313.1 SURF1 family protein [Actinomycetota bacterium]
MYRFLLRPRWLLFHLLVVGAIVLMVNLGFWQLRRFDERQQFNAQVETSIAAPPAPLDDVLAAGTDPATVEWRRVSATGTYLPAETIAVVNRSQGGAAGDLIVTPLQLDDGRILLVERGFVPLSATADLPPAGQVEVSGRLRPSQERRRGGLSDPSSGELREAQRVDVDRLAAQLPGPLVPMYVELVSSTPPEAAASMVPVAIPDLVDGPHLSYAGQWFIFAIAVGVGWVLAVRRSVRFRVTTATDVAAPEPEDERTAAPSSR